MADYERLEAAIKQLIETMKIQDERMKKVIVAINRLNRITKPKLVVGNK